MASCSAVGMSYPYQAHQAPQFDQLLPQRPGRWMTYPPGLKSGPHLLDIGLLHILASGVTPFAPLPAPIRAVSLSPDAPTASLPAAHPGGVQAAGQRIDRGRLMDNLA